MNIYSTVDIAILASRKIAIFMWLFTENKFYEPCTLV